MPYDKVGNGILSILVGVSDTSGSVLYGILSILFSDSHHPLFKASQLANTVGAEHQLACYPAHSSRCHNNTSDTTS